MNNKPIQWALPKQLTTDHKASLEAFFGIVELSSESGMFQKYLRLYGEELPRIKAKSGIDSLIDNAIIKSITEKYISGFVKFVYEYVYLRLPDSALSFKRQMLIVDDWTLS